MATTDRPPQVPSRRRWRWYVGLPVGTLLVALGVSEALGWRYLRAPLAAQASKAAGVPVEIGAPFRLHLLGSPRVSGGSLHVAAARGSEAPYLLKGGGLAVQARWADLYQSYKDGVLRLRSVRADHLEADLRRPKVGVASWQLGQPAGEPKPQQGPAPVPRIDELLLRDARIAVHDEPTQVDLDLRLSLEDGSGDGGTSRQGFLARATGYYKTAPLEAELSSPRLLPVVAAPDSEPLDVKASARLGQARASFEGRLAGLLGTLALDGKIAASGPSLAAAGEPLGVTLPSTPPFELAGRLRRDGTLWQADIAQADIGRSRLQGDFRFDNGGTRPRLDGRLQGSRLVLGDLAPSLGAPAPSAASKTKAAETDQVGARADQQSVAARTRVLPDKPFDLPSLNAMDADIRIDLQRLDFGTSALESLQPLKAWLRLDDGKLRIDELLARTAGGSLSGSTELDAGSKLPRWRADLRWSDVDLEGWARGLRQDDSKVSARSSDAKLTRERQAARQDGAEVRALATGLINGRAQLQGEGRSVAQILGSLDGRMRTELRDGSISHLLVEALGLDVAQALGVFVRGDQSLPLRCAVVDVQARQGVLDPRAALLDTQDSRVLIDGQVDLGKERLDLRAVARPKDWTVMSLRTPLKLTGTFSQPEASVESGPLIARAVAAAVLATFAPPAAMLPFIDPGDEGDNAKASTECLPPQTQAKAKPASDRQGSGAR